MNDAGHLPDSTLNEYLDGALALPAEAEAHLAGCAHCTARLAELRGLYAALSALPDLPLERDLAPAVVAAVRQASPARAAPAPRLALPLGLRLALAVQALAALAVGVAAWPFAARWFPATQTALAAREAAQGVGMLVAAGLAELGSLARLPIRLRGDFAALDPLPLHLLPPEGWAAILAGLILLGVLGNGLLLGLARNRPRPLSRRNS